MKEKIERLNRDYGKGEAVRFTLEHGGFPFLKIKNRFAEATIALQGAHLCHYARHQDVPLLWLSECAVYKAGKAIRGGVPVCWPWFGTHPKDASLPNHGFARTADWAVLKVKEQSDGTTEAVFWLRDTPESLSMWPYRFRLSLRFVIGSKLTLELTTENCDEEAFEIGCALHTYFNVSGIEDVAISGLEELRYFDKLDSTYKVQRGAVRFSEETDRVYLDPPAAILLEDARRTVRVQPRGSRSTVVWNPWADKARSFDDMQNEAYQDMVCIETANTLDDRRTIKTGERHTLGFEISLP
jgi:glucose-6-phosphate 1-epimerase